MVKNLMRLVAIMLIALTSQVSFAATPTTVQSSSTNSLVHINGGVNPWPPMGTELPFPWDDIPGVWRGYVDGQNVIFSFQVIKSITSGERQIKVKQLSSNGMQVISTGTGTEKNQVVIAVMTSGRDKRYMLTVRLVQDEYCWENRNQTVVTMQHMKYNDFVYLFAIEKLSNTPLTQGQPIYYNPAHLQQMQKVLMPNPFCFY